MHQLFQKLLIMAMSHTELLFKQKPPIYHEATKQRRKAMNYGIES